MKCKKCGNEIRDNDSFCMKCGEPVLADNMVHKKSKKKIVIPIVVIAVVIFLVIIIIAVSNSENNTEKSFDDSNQRDNNYEYQITTVENTTENNTDSGLENIKDNSFDNNQSDNDYKHQITATEITTENKTEVQEYYNPIGKEILQYPSQDDIFTYNVYETYVEITGSVKDDLTGELVIPETIENLPVRSISNRAFGGAGEGSTIPGYSISSLVLPDSLYKISDGAFYRCINLNSITFGDNIVSIGPWAFSYTKITILEIPDTVTDIGSNVFLECKNLEKVILGKSMTFISDSMFDGCTNLSSIEWNENINTIGTSAFRSTAFETICLPNTIVSVEGKAFSYMRNLKEFTFSDSVTEIKGYFVLEHCEKLEKVTIGKGINSIPKYSFSDSSSITELIIPANVTNIHSNIFGEGTFDAYAKPTIYGKKGSKAAAFASAKGLKFEIIDR